MANVWDDKKALAKLEMLRNEARSPGKRLTFDCMHLKMSGDRVYCSKGHLLGQAKDGSLSLVAILRGFTSGACLYCGDYTEED